MSHACLEEELVHAREYDGRKCETCLYYEKQQCRLTHIGVNAISHCDGWNGIVRRPPKNGHPKSLNSASDN